uniref:Uncharacterized protein n=1 Tax=Tanacetum cinerariifolium TaxID=118510 RepID=A0A699XCR6_TANCI|nr:hypothetical protein [Tanacetum cinerariifolium]
MAAEKTQKGSHRWISPIRPRSRNCASASLRSWTPMSIRRRRSSSARLPRAIAGSPPPSWKNSSSALAMPACGTCFCPTRSSAPG